VAEDHGVLPVDYDDALVLGDVQLSCGTGAHHALV
jgi:hypothetical protein